MSSTPPTDKTTNSNSNHHHRHQDNSVDNSVPIIRRRKDLPNSRRSRNGLIKYAKDYTSQNGEDGIIEKIFQLIQATPTPTPTVSVSESMSPVCPYRTCVDVGAWDGKHLSNTYSLLVGGNPSPCSASTSQSLSSTSSALWRGILIEADTQRCEELKKLHEPLGNVCLNIEVSCMDDDEDSHDDNDNGNKNGNGLVSILRRVQLQQEQQQKACNNCEEVEKEASTNYFILPNDFDFLSIDVDGIDYWLLHDIFNSGNDNSNDSSNNNKNNNDHHYHHVAQPFQPKVICVEFNPTIPDDLIYIPCRNDNIRHGCSLAALVELCQLHHYTLIETTLYNAFFVRDDLYYSNNNKQLQELVPDTSIETLHEITMGTTLYQLYDGTMKLHGCKKLLWHRIPIDEQQIQILHHHQRGTFPYAQGLAGGGGRGGGPSKNSTTKTTTTTTTATTTSQLSPQEIQAIYDDAIDMSSYCCNNTEMGHGNNDDSHNNNNEVPGSVNNESTHNDNDKSTCSKQLVNKLKLNGFCYIRGTNISKTICEDALQATNTFFHVANEEVRRSCLSTKDRARRGYSPINTENFASLIGTVGPNDLVRKFRIGPKTTTRKTTGPTPSTSTLNDPTIANTKPDPVESESTTSSSTSTSTNPSNSSLLQDNVWPSEDVWSKEECDKFRTTLESYYDEVCNAAHSIVCAICDGLTQTKPELCTSDGAGEGINVLSSMKHDTSRGEGNGDGNDNVLSSNVAHTSILTLLGYSKGTRHKIGGNKKKKKIHPLVAAHTDGTSPSMHPCVGDPTATLLMERLFLRVCVCVCVCVCLRVSNFTNEAMNFFLTELTSLNAISRF